MQYNINVIEWKWKTELVFQKIFYKTFFLWSVYSTHVLISFGNIRILWKQLTLRYIRVVNTGFDFKYDSCLIYLSQKCSFIAVWYQPDRITSYSYLINSFKYIIRHKLNTLANGNEKKSNLLIWNYIRNEQNSIRWYPCKGLRL